MGGSWMVHGGTPRRGSTHRWTTAAAPTTRRPFFLFLFLFLFLLWFLTNSRIILLRFFLRLSPLWQMRLAESGLSGNKARKLYALNRTPADSFPRVVASHGGPQVWTYIRFVRRRSVP